MPRRSGSRHYARRRRAATRLMPSRHGSARSAQSGAARSRCRSAGWRLPACRRLPLHEVGSDRSSGSTSRRQPLRVRTAERDPRRGRRAETVVGLPVRALFASSFQSAAAHSRRTRSAYVARLEVERCPCRAFPRASGAPSRSASAARPRSARCRRTRSPAGASGEPYARPDEDLSLRCWLGDDLTRDGLVKRLAEVSHKTWIKQNDLERAEAAVQDLR